MSGDAAAGAGKQRNFGIGRGISTFVGVAVGVLAIVGALLLVAWVLSQKVAGPNLPQVDTNIALPILAVCAVITLLGVLSLVAIGFRLVGLGDEKQALGLPDGSIRSVIALSLIVLFAIFCVYLYSTLSSPGRLESVTGLTDATVKSFEQSLPPGAFVSDVVSGPNHTVLFHAGLSQASNDFAKQILTLMGTLVTAIASFYFGSAAVASAVAQVNPPATPSPKPGSFSPTSGAHATSITLTILGSGLGGVDGVYLKDASGTSTASVKPTTATDGYLTVNLALPATAGTYQVICHAGGKEYPVPGSLAVQ
jgi:hypothetical protein